MIIIITLFLMKIMFDIYKYMKSGLRKAPPKLKKIVSNKMLCDLPYIDKILGNRQMLKDYLNEGWEAITKKLLGFHTKFILNI